MPGAWLLSAAGGLVPPLERLSVIVLDSTASIPACDSSQAGSLPAGGGAIGDQGLRYSISFSRWKFTRHRRPGLEVLYFFSSWKIEVLSFSPASAEYFWHHTTFKSQSGAGPPQSTDCLAIIKKRRKNPDFQKSILPPYLSLIYAFGLTKPLISKKTNA